MLFSFGDVRRGEMCGWRTLVSVGTVVVMMWMVGCEFKGMQGGERVAVEGEVWQPRPESLRVHPTTRFVQRGGDEVTLQARIEFHDAMGDSVKGVGAYRLELFASDEMGRNVSRRLYQWQIDVRTLAAQRSYYDAVTRSYLFRLRLDDAAPPTQPTLLRVTFIPADQGERLESATVLTAS
ncbi:hypothetical protein ACERK3_10865 [Phycisphaerales bacterium AB-hyl4]|uniref:Uncharacterized protein n=1 Tax=Natronomicrosphaera hydrolytica TaxID=3242702 RepID=A0ABV4U7H5_9BACT